MRTFILFSFGFLAFIRPAKAGVVLQNNVWIVSGKNYSVGFNSRTGAIVDARQAGQANTIFKSGLAGLWSAKLQGGTEVTASEFGLGAAGHTLLITPDRATNALKLLFKRANFDVAVTVTGRDESVDFIAEVTPRKGTVIEFALPARLRFAPAQIDRFIAPMDSNQSVGAEFGRGFFESQRIAVSWAPQRYADAGYKMLAGGPLAAMRGATQTDTAPSKLTVTESGKQWLGEALSKRIEGSKALVNRPPTREQSKFVLVDSPDGPYLGAHIIGEGGFWQIGGFVGDLEAANVQDMMTEVMNRLEETAPEGRRKLGVLSLDNSPAHGWWTTITMRDWLDRCRDIAGAHLGKVDVVSLSTATDIQAALAAKDFILILNPYGEWLPLLTNNGNDDDLKTTIAAIKAFATAGGHWIETGGYPFYYAMRPQHFVNYSVSYPPAFADFFHIDGNGGALSIYGVRPAPSVPWNKDAIFVPGQLGLGGDVISGFCDRSFGAWVVANQSWTTPITRFAFGREAPADLAAYAKENGLTRRLTDKLPVTALDKFKNAVLVKYDGSAKEKSAKLDRLPPASLLYFDDYCKGGLNKEFPDVLPPAAGFGTSADLRAFLDRCRQAGHLTMPHTDPTWWSDKPRGATFAKAGDAPLMRGLDGKTIAEPIGTAEGWLVSPWHAAVQVANRFTVKQFSEEFPVDFLFRGGNGARVWRHDLNPAVPSPISGPDGLLAQLSEDSKVRPLATEAGWDRASDSAVMLSGMTLGLTADDDVSARPLLGEFYPPATWKLFPMAQYLSHDRVAMTLHSQNQDVNNPRTLAWALGMGFGLNFHTATSALAGDGRHDWLLWLDRLQKSVGSRYVGEPVNDFQLLRARRTDDGVIRAVYGQVNIVANLNDEPLPEAGRDLAAYGFRATAPGLLAATQKLVGGQDFGADGVSFVAENRDGKFDLWVYAPPERDVAVELPGTPPNVQLTFDGGVKIPVTAQNGAIRFRLPSRPGQQARVLPPAELIGKSPQDWPGAKPAIGVLGLAGLEASGSKILPEAWYSAFTESRLAKKFGLAVKPISTVAELNAALTAGPTAWLAIINPYGEKLPCSGPGNGKEMLAAVRRYVQNGGVWWETGGESFSAATFLGGTAEKPAWQTEPLAGAAILGLPIGTGDDSKNTPDLRLTPTGREWLGSALATRIEGRESSTCRSLPRTGEDPGHVTVLTGAGRDFMGGYRLRGWGWLWRIGGLRPNSAVVLPAAVAATEYVFTHPPIPAQDGIRYLWHATM